MILHKVKRLLEEKKKIEEISKIISESFNLPTDDDKVQKASEAIYVKFYGPRTRVDP